MFGYISKIGKSEVYHGEKRNDNFFEGWFYKIVDKDEKNILAIIPGIFKSKEKSKAHSFIQILDGKSNLSYYIKYGVDEFSTKKNKFEINIGDSFFSAEELMLDLKDDGISLSGTLHFIKIFKWPNSIISPGIMGWYSYVPFMECNHGIISLNHGIEGSLNYNSSQINFTDGKGYGEKDWGSSFPSAYVWLQSNHFSDESISLTASVAKIPWLFSSFRGYIIGLKIGTKLFRLTTYTGAVLNFLRVNENFVELEVSDKNNLLYIKADRTKGGVLHGPYNNEMTKRVSESLDSKIFVRLTDKLTNKIILEDFGRNSGLDINGNLKEIVD